MNDFYLKAKRDLYDNWEWHWKAADFDKADGEYIKANGQKKFEEALLALSNSKDWKIRYRVARDPNTPIFILEKLSGDPENLIRCAVIQNKNITPEILRKIYEKETEMTVKQRLAASKKIDKDILIEFSKEKSPLIQHEIVMNSSSPNEALENLVDIKAYRIGLYAKRELELRENNKKN